ncbi:hypothetical protein T484DRAFT_1957427 [Baffinella frigidus]|nr:hypothetical protein T484DRAFT_1957427 [Cryptophyta sp. CCMP2293]
MAWGHQPRHVLLAGEPLPRPHSVSSDGFRIRHRDCTVAGRGGASAQGTVHPPWRQGHPAYISPPTRLGRRSVSALSGSRQKGPSRQE